MKEGFEVTKKDIEVLDSTGVRVYLVQPDDPFQESPEKVRVGQIRERGVDLNFDERENGAEFVISRADFELKFSEGYVNCSGFCVVSRSKEGRSAGFITHQRPPFILLSKYKTPFLRAFGERVQELKNISGSDDLDIVYFGGDRPDNWQERIDQYEAMTDTLTQAVEEIAGTTVKIIKTPHTDRTKNHSTSVYLDTDTGNIFIVNK